MPQRILLGDEAVALGAAHAGVTCAYGYPGTPSTEILEFLLDRRNQRGPRAAWCANEKTAYEAALGTCFAGRRALVGPRIMTLGALAREVRRGAPGRLRDHSLGGRFSIR